MSDPNPRQDPDGHLFWPARVSRGTYICQGTETFWHVTAESHLQSIREQGLQAAVGRFEPLNYLKGVYLFSSPDAAEVFLKDNERWERDEYGEEQAEVFFILEVHPPPGTILHQDPFSDDASGLGRFSFYSPSPIGTECLILPVVQSGGGLDSPDANTHSL